MDDTKYWKWDLVPLIPTSLAELKQSLNAGKDIPVGTEIPDKFNGVDSPWIVGTNTTVTLVDGTQKRAVGLFRKYVYAANTGAARVQGSFIYNTTPLYTYFKNTYYNMCSDEAKAMMANVKIYQYNNISNDTCDAIVFPLSIEQCGAINTFGQYNKPIADTKWEYFNDHTAGAKISDSDVNYAEYWLRNATGGDYNYSWDGSTYVFGNGLERAGSYSTRSGIRAACYVVAD